MSFKDYYRIPVIRREAFGRANMQYTVFWIDPGQQLLRKTENDALPPHWRDRNFPESYREGKNGNQDANVASPNPEQLRVGSDRVIIHSDHPLAAGISGSILSHCHSPKTIPNLVLFHDD